MTLTRPLEPAKRANLYQMKEHLQDPEHLWPIFGGSFAGLLITLILVFSPCERGEFASYDTSLSPLLLEANQEY